MKRRNRHLFQVILKIEDRDDIRSDWNTTEKVIFQTWSKELAQSYLYHHQYLETQLEPDDDGTSWLHITSIYIEQVK